MSELTHIFREAGNGFPQHGDQVLTSDLEVKTLVASGRINTDGRPGSSWWMEVGLIDSDVEWWELSDEERTERFDSMHHVESK